MIGLVNFYEEDREEKIKELNNFIGSVTDATIVEMNSWQKNISGIVLSGSGRLITKNQFKDEWIECILKTEKPLLGICFGFQLICRAYGAVFEHRDKMKGLYPVKKVTPHPLFDGLPEKTELHESHQEFVTAVEHPLLITMISPAGIEAVVHEDKPVYGTQFHFERTPEKGNIILKNFLNLIPD